MPLFGSKREASPPRTVTTTTTHKNPNANRSSGLFGRKKSASPERTVTTTTHSPSRSSGSIFSRGSNNTNANTVNTANTSHSSSGGGLLHRNTHEDPSIVRARERLVNAENAEREADRALVAARAAVQAARNEMKALEHEAAEQARLAKIKQGQAASLSKRGKHLGRHDHHV